MKYKNLSYLILALCLALLPSLAGAQPLQVSGYAKILEKAAQTTARQAGQLSQTVAQVGAAQAAAPLSHQLPSTAGLVKVLHARAQRTYVQAIAAQEKAADSPSGTGLVGGPVIRRSPISLFPLSPVALYPDKPFLNKPVVGSFLTEQYFLAESNRHYMRHLQDMEKFWPKFTEAIPRFYNEAENLTQPKDLLSWTVQQIPSDTNVLFIGERHGYRELPDFCARLLGELSKLNPEREIILFTEFLPNTRSKGYLLNIFPYKNKYHYEPIWETAKQNGIRVIGLEDKYVFEAPYKVTTHPEENDGPSREALWATLEGIRIRNEHWLEIINEYRADHPTALFVVYTGAGHSLYQFPFSLAKHFDTKTTFMLDLVPQECWEEGEHFLGKDILEEMHPLLSFPQSVLKWKERDLVELSGFDVRVKLPIDIKAKKADDLRSVWTDALNAENPLMMPPSVDPR